MINSNNDSNNNSLQKPRFVKILFLGNEMDVKNRVEYLKNLLDASESVSPYHEQKTHFNNKDFFLTTNPRPLEIESVLFNTTSIVLCPEDEHDLQGLIRLMQRYEEDKKPHISIFVALDPGLLNTEPMLLQVLKIVMELGLQTLPAPITPDHRESFLLALEADIALTPEEKQKNKDERIQEYKEFPQKKGYTHLFFQGVKDFSPDLVNIVNQYSAPNTDARPISNNDSNASSSNNKTSKK